MGSGFKQTFFQERDPNGQGAQGHLDLLSHQGNRCSKQPLTPTDRPAARVGRVWRRAGAGRAGHGAGSHRGKPPRVSSHGYTWDGLMPPPQPGVPQGGGRAMPTPLLSRQGWGRDVLPTGSRAAAASSREKCCPAGREGLAGTGVSLCRPEANAQRRGFHEAGRPERFLLGTGTPVATELLGAGWGRNVTVCCPHQTTVRELLTDAARYPRSALCSQGLCSAGLSPAFPRPPQAAPAGTTPCSAGPGF